MLVEAAFDVSKTGAGVGNGASVGSGVGEGRTGDGDASTVPRSRLRMRTTTGVGSPGASDQTGPAVGGSSACAQAVNNSEQRSKTAIRVVFEELSTFSIPRFDNDKMFHQISKVI